MFNGNKIMVNVAFVVKIILSNQNNSKKMVPCIKATLLKHINKEKLSQLMLK